MDNIWYFLHSMVNNVQTVKAFLLSLPTKKHYYIISVIPKMFNSSAVTEYIYDGAKL